MDWPYSFCVQYRHLPKTTSRRKRTKNTTNPKHATKKTGLLRDPSLPHEILDCLRNGVSRLLLIEGPIQNMISSQHQPTKQPKQPPLPFMNKGQVLIERADFPRFCVGFRPILGVRTREKTAWRKLFVYPIP